MHTHSHHQELILEILQQIATEKNRSLAKTKRLLFIKHNDAISHRFWDLLDNKLLNHPYIFVGCCPDCGHFELR